jgi:hypothetical protein
VSPGARTQRVDQKAQAEADYHGEHHTDGEGQPSNGRGRQRQLEGQPSDHHRHGKTGQHSEAGASQVLGEQRRLQVDWAEKVGTDLTSAHPPGQLTFAEDHHNGQQTLPHPDEGDR